MPAMYAFVYPIKHISQSITTVVYTYHYGVQVDQVTTTTHYHPSKHFKCDNATFCRKRASCDSLEGHRHLINICTYCRES